MANNQQNDYIIETKKLTKFYGRKRGIKNVSLKINKGEIFGFLGPNGAGKTTTIKTLLHLLNPSSGEGYIFGKDITKDYVEISQEVGYLPGEFELYSKWTGLQMLKFSAKFYRHKKSNGEFAKEVIKRLGCEMDKQFKKLSRGNKQKIGLLLAMFHQPKLLILDEPTNGLDPFTQIELYHLLKDMKKNGTTTFFSSHNLPEVEKVCDRVGIIKEGILVDVEQIEEMKKHRRKVVEIHFKDAIKIDSLKSLIDIEILRSGDKDISFYLKHKDINLLLNVLANYDVQDINFAYPDLEEVFLKYYEK